jgi:uncharacterized membrane protein
VTTPPDEPGRRGRAAAAPGDTPAAPDSPAVEARAADRIIFFSDGVVAIAITLLALELPVPDVNNASVHQYLMAVGHHWRAYTAFLISFAVISLHWNVHRRVFRYVDRLARPVAGLNLTWLLMMILTPFGARLLDSSGGFPVRFSTYALIQVIALSCLLRIDYVAVHRNLLRPDTPESFRHRDSLPTLIQAGTFLLSIPVSFVTEWSFALWGTTPAIMAVVRHVRKRRGAAHPDERL